ncbi:MAG TPA: hypothetical protein VH120_14400 [Gemmataceae bacterium]|jgi:hypothetical protein|nr:hypothetical protein [Gemmataceae bacterium]
MSLRVAVSALILVGWAGGPSSADEKHVAVKHDSANPAFEKFKQLAGEWVAKQKGEDGKEVHVSYKVTSGGSAVVETIMPGGEHEMVSVIHPDGGDVILTHYCMLGNQPQMRASGAGHGNSVEFKFVRATNLKSDKAMYMHDATFTFVDADTLRTTWTLYNEGKAEKQEVFELKRKSAAP